MPTYRTGNHWGVTIVAEGRFPEGEHDSQADELVAVVTNGDTALAERICALLNKEAGLEEKVERHLGTPRPPHPGEKFWWPTDCTTCDKPIGPWSPDLGQASGMTHIVDGGAPDWEANRDHAPTIGDRLGPHTHGGTE